MGQMNKIGKHKTKVMTTNKSGRRVTEVKYHDTVVVEFSEHEIVLNSGGFRSATTKGRMNQTANEFLGLDYHVYQEKGRWWVQYGGKDWLFEDRMLLYRHLGKCSTEKRLVVEADDKRAKWKERSRRVTEKNTSTFVRLCDCDACKRKRGAS